MMDDLDSRQDDHPRQVPETPLMADDNRGQAVGLGCGTLILIALIVLVLTDRGANEIKREIRDLRTEFGQLRKALDAQTDLIKAMKAAPGRPGD